VSVSSPPAPADLASLAARHRATVWRYLRVLGSDPTLADDLTQEVFLVVLRHRDFTVRDEVGALAFLRTTARHLYLRSRRRRTSPQEVAAADAIWNEQCGDGDGSPRLDALRLCLQALPERSRALLEATYGAELGRAAAARAFGMSQDGIKSALRRLRASLQECIERRQGNEP
jgi:RNA polymerase sigma-70 factor (ECF subfamily)